MSKNERRVDVVLFVMSALCCLQISTLSAVAAAAAAASRYIDDRPLIEVDAYRPRNLSALHTTLAAANPLPPPPAARPLQIALMSAALLRNCVMYVRVHVLMFYVPQLSC